MADSANTGIYEIVNLVNGKRYIGSAVSFDKRWKTHLHWLIRGSHHSRHLQASWSKWGQASFGFRKILVCTKDNLIFYEQLAFDTLKPEYNIYPRAGSALGHKHSAETKAKLSASKIGNKHTLGYRHTPESLAKLSNAKLGNTATKGKKRARSAVEKTAAAHRGMKRSEETRAKISAAMSGSKKPPRSEEYRLKISRAHKGRTKSSEHMASLQEGRGRRIYTEAQRTKLSLAMLVQYESGLRSRVRSAEYRQNISASLSGRTLTPEHRANVAAAMRGKKRGPYKTST